MSDSSQIAFVEHFAPALTAGVYEIAVTPSVGEVPGLLPGDIREISEWIYVGGERFKLDPSDVDSVYPPNNGEGTFNNTLPHVVIRRSGIPWERVPEPPKQGFARASWLALLLFDEDDPAPTPKTISIDQLVKEKIPAHIWFPEKFKVEPSEDPKAKCNIIDISTDVFREITPKITELPYLAHARSVSTENKAGGKAGEIVDFALVIGNRLPKAGKESVVHLVSLEDYGPVLNEEDNESDFRKCQTVRLISLMSWRFSCQVKGGNFNDLYGALNNGMGLKTKAKASPSAPLYLHYPVEDGKGSKQVNDILVQGYIPMEHQFRQGLNSVSFYRGPLAPLPVERFLPTPFNSPDGLLIYDPDSKFYDVSYAAAWQLGQLLALRNKNFARAQFFWKHQASLDARKRMERQLLEEKMPVVRMQDEEGNPLEAIPIPSFGDISATMDKGVSSRQLETKQDIGLREHFNGDMAFKQTKSSEWYKTIEDYIQDLKRLKDVPFNYLVPGPRMLPEESIRLFYVDPNWVDALVDGAFSVGDVVKADLKRKEILKPHDGKSTPLSGFILRSKILAIWPGVEVLGVNAKGKRLQFLRIERLSEDLLICIFDGEMTELEFREPPEGLHFGVGNLRGEPLTFDKTIRDLKGKEWAKIDSFRTEARGVINMKSLANKIGSMPGQNKVFGDLFTTADFGYLMLQPVSAIRFKFNNKK